MWTRRDAMEEGACSLLMFSVHCTTLLPPSLPSLVLIMTTLPRYRLQNVPPAGVESAPPSELCLDVGISTRDTTEGSVPVERPPEELPDTKHPCEESPDTADIPAESPATSKKRGSLNYDREHSKWPLEWEDLADFEAWRREEELLHSIDTVLSHLPLRTEARGRYGRSAAFWFVGASGLAGRANT